MVRRIKNQFGCLKQESTLRGIALVYYRPIALQYISTLVEKVPQNTNESQHSFQKKKDLIIKRQKLQVQCL